MCTDLLRTGRLVMRNVLSVCRNLSHYPTRYLARIVLVIGCRFCRELYHYPTRYLVRIVLVIGRLLVDYWSIRIFVIVFYIYIVINSLLLVSPLLVLLLSHCTKSICSDQILQDRCETRRHVLSSVYVFRAKLVWSSPSLSFIHRS